MVGPAMDCLNNPLGAVRILFEKACGSQAGSIEDTMRSDWGAKELFDIYLQQQGGFKLVPEINSAPLSAIPANSLVRFRGMVQDMFDVEYFLGAYRDGNVWRTTKYSDATDFLVRDDSETQMCDRRLLYCVPVPGENDWVKEALSSSSQRLITNNPVACVPTSIHSDKRPRETDSHNDVDMDFQLNAESLDSKRTKEEAASIDLVGRASQDLDLNMPLGKSTFTPCIVKVYDGGDADIKLNDVIEFTGVLAFDPELSASSFSRRPAEDVYLQPLIDENVCSRLPASRVPRLHAITFRKLSSHRIDEAFPRSDDMDTSVVFVGNGSLSLLFRGHPLMTDNFTAYHYPGTPDTVKQMRDSILQGLTNVLGGDHLTAEYILLHLLSQVHHRLDSMVLGKISLNICTGPLEPNESSLPLATRIAEAVQSLLPCSHLMSLSLDNLNRSLLAPRKDYVLNRLVTGSLQLAEGTHLTLDETALNTGQLTSVGIQNIQSLKHLIEWQKVEYDFEYYKLDMTMDIPVLIVSNAKSLFPADVVIPLRSTCKVSSFTEDKSEIARWRQFLTSVRNMDHKLDATMQKLIEGEIVDARQSDRSLTPEIFHRWLSLARLLSLSHGESTLKLQRWRKVREMEQLRQERLRCL